MLLFSRVKQILICLKDRYMTRYTFLFMMLSSSVFAQALDLKSGDISITSSDGAVWNRAKQTIQIKQDATVLQGDTKLLADTINIQYNEADGKQEITGLDAIGNVFISTPTEVIKGDKARYEPLNGVAVLNGKEAQLVMKDGTVDAKVFEYFEKENKTVATGDVVLNSLKGKATAQKAVAYFQKIKNNNTITKIEMFDDIVVTTEKEIVKGNKGVYNIHTGIINIKDSVYIQQGKNVLKGGEVEVNLKTGVSRLKSSAGQRATGVIVPKKK